MSIAQKLEYLDTTKQLLKTEINKINNVLDDNSTFRSYPQELFNGYLDILNNGTDTLWSNLEKVSQTGTEATLEGVETAPIKMVLNGNTSQETTTGKNLANFPENKDLVESQSGKSYLLLDLGEDKKIDAFTTTLFFENVIFSNQSANGAIVDFRKNDGTHQYRTPGAFADGSNVLKGNGVSNTGAFAHIERNITFRYLYYIDYNHVTQGTGSIQAEYGSTATPYEPYTGGQPSPSPDYPQEVKVVKGENVVSVSGKNLFDKSLFRDFTDAIKFISLNLKPNTQYTVSSDIPISYNSANLFALNSTGNPSTTTNGVTPSTARTITTLDDGILRIGYRDNGNYLVDEANTYWYQVEEGSTATPYVPYSKTDYPINLVSKNLFSTENLVNATITDTGEYLTGDNRCTGDYVFLDKSQENLALSFSLNILFMGIAFYDENKQYLSRATINNTNLLTAPIPANAEYCRPFFQFTTSPAAKIDAKIIQLLETQLEYGTERTNYVSYFTPIELCKINTYKDYFYKDSGKWYVHKEIGKVVLDGSESWNKSSSTANTIFYLNGKISYINGSTSSSINLYCNYFEGKIVWARNVIGCELYPENSIRFGLTTSSTITTIEQWKTWLSTHNTIVYYVLATPTETEITNSTLIEQLEAISNAKSVKDKTYITQTNDDLPFILDVEAIKEYEVN